MALRRLLAPGTALREAIELVLRQGTGGLVILDGEAKSKDITNGGFDLAGAEFTPQRLAELAKMDGAIVTDGSAEFILKANVHLIPDSSISTDETGTRMRTAERVAIQTGMPAIAISEGRSSAIVFTSEGQFELQSPTALRGKANQSVQSLERFRRRLDEAAESLTRAEVDDMVTVRDVVLPLQRAALVRRLGEEVKGYAVEMGREAGLTELQMADLLEGVDTLADLVYGDYARRRPSKPHQLHRLDDLSLDDLYDPAAVGSAFSLPPLDASVRPRGLRALSHVPRLPDSVKEALISHFGDFQKLLHATAGELDQVEGVGRHRAQILRHYFDQMLEMSPTWRFRET